MDVSKIDMTTTVLGFSVSMPIMIAPTAMQKMAHPDGTNFNSCIYSNLVLLLLNGKGFALYMFSSER